MRVPIKWEDKREREIREEKQRVSRRKIEWESKSEEKTPLDTYRLRERERDGDVEINWSIDYYIDR